MSQDLKNLIKTQVPISMKLGDKFKTSVLRMILSEIQKLEIEEKCELNENQIISILEKMIKQRKDSITQFEQANRQELADKEKLERTLLVSIPTEIYPYLFEVFSFLIEKSGLPKLKVEKTVDFEKLYQQRNK